jgi:hypothetical protein
LPPINSASSAAWSSVRLTTVISAAPARASSPIDDGDFGRAGQGEFDRDGPGHSARPEQDDALLGRISLPGERLDQGLALGVFADQFVLVADDQVDHAGQPGGLRRAVQVRKDRPFVRLGTVAAAKAQCPEPAYRVAQIVRRDLQRQIPPVQLVVGERLFGHVLRRVPGRGPAEQGEDGLKRRIRHGGVHPYKLVKRTRPASRHCRPRNRPVQRLPPCGQEHDKAGDCRAAHAGRLGAEEPRWYD